MFWNHLYWFVGASCMFLVSLANVVRPTVQAELGGWIDRDVKLAPAQHQSGKLEFWLTMLVITFIVWLITAYRVAVLW